MSEWQNMQNKPKPASQVSFPKLNKIGWQSLTFCLMNLDVEKSAKPSIGDMVDLG